MNKIKGLVAISAFALLVLGLPAVASAQWNGGYGGYGNRGSYGNGNIRSAVQRLKDKAERFENSVDRFDDRRDDRRNDRRNRGGWGNSGGYGSDNLERLADQFKNAADRLEDAYGRGRNMDNSYDEARRVLDLASAIDQQIYNARGGRNLQGQWNSMRQELNMIASAYGYNNGYPNRNNRRNRNNGGWRNNFPF